MIMASPLNFRLMTPGYIVPFGEDFYDVGDQVLCLSINTHVQLTFQENSKPKCELHLENYKHTISFSFNKFTEDVLSKIPPLKNASALDFNWETPELLDLKNYMPIIIAFVSSVTQFKLVDMNHENALFSFFLVAAGILCSLDLEIKPFTVFIKSDIPTTICAGSTAAHSVCIAAAFVHYIRLMVMKTNNLKNNISKSNYKMSILSPFNLNVFHTREKDTVFKWSCLCEMLMPGNTRGIGSAICTYGYLLLFSKGESEFRPSLKPFVSVQKMDALIIDTGVRQDKNVMKKSLIMFKQHFPEVLESIMTIEKIIFNIIVEMLAVSQTSVKKVEFGELEFGDVMDLDQCLHLVLELVDPAFDEIQNMMRREGFKCRIFGTGAGVHFSVLVPLSHSIQESSIKELKNLLKKKNYPFFITQMCVYGPEINNLSSD